MSNEGRVDNSRIRDLSTLVIQIMRPGFGFDSTSSMQDVILRIYQGFRDDTPWLLEQHLQET
jgi:hypothetical protein